MSRVAPPDVPPVELYNVRYTQETQGLRHGLDQSTGYLVAEDPRSGKRLWVLKVYEDVEIPGIEGDVQRCYFTRMEPVPGQNALAIENEDGERFLVDLVRQTVTQQA